MEGRARDLAMFNLAINSKLCGCDVVAFRVEDVAAGSYTADRATVRQKKTGRPVRFELSEQTRQPVGDEGCQQEARRVLVHRSARRESQHDDPPICAPHLRVDQYGQLDALSIVETVVIAL
jgi:hypothetical protein